MGIALFVLVFVVEVAFAVCCLRTKSYQTRAKGIVSVAALASFVLVVGLGPLEWGLRYYALAALLLWLALIGTVRLVRRQPDTRAFMAKRVVLQAIGMTVLFLLVIAPAMIFPEYRPLDVSGEYQVASVTFTYTDTNRIETYSQTGGHRKLNVELWYPANANGQHPLVVFSHGGISDRSSNESLYRELASHGYVVAAIDHTYHAISTTDVDGSTIRINSGYMRDLQAEDAKTDKEGSYALYQEWMGVRTGDISFVIDQIQAEAANINAALPYRLVDTRKIGVMGHSLGGSATLAMGRIRDDVGAVIALESPFMYDIVGVKGNAFVLTDEVYPVPVLNVYSDSAWSHVAEWPQYARNHELLSDTGGTAFNVHIRGVGHFTLTDLALASPLLTRMLNGFSAEADTAYCLRTINRVSLAFFDAYLKGTGPFTLGGEY